MTHSTIRTVTALLALTLSGHIAASDDEARSVIQTSGVTGGLIVHVGCKDGGLTAALGTGKGFIVQGLDTDKENIAKARQLFHSKKLQGKATVTVYNGKHLPYTDNLVNLLVVSEPAGISKEEIIRVLAPLGIACVKEGAAWKKIPKAWPDSIDEWTHYLHGPDNNAVANDTVIGPPRHLHWVAGPRWTRNHHKLNSVSSVVTAKGRLYYIIDQATAANSSLPGKWALVARDAFSGVQLWSKPMKSWAWHMVGFRSGPPQVTRLLVVSGNRLYAPLGLNEPVSVMDGVTGKTLQTYDATAAAEELILTGDTLLVLKGAPVAAHAVRHADFKSKLKLPNQKSIMAIDTTSGSTRWEWKCANGTVMPETLGSDGKKVYAQVDNGVVCLDLKDGKKLWGYGLKASPAGGKPRGKKGKGKKPKVGGYGKSVLVVASDVVLCMLSGKLTALSAVDGKKLWECQGGMGFHAPADIFVIDGLVWLGDHPRDSISPPPVRDFSEGRDLHTGEIKARNQIAVDLQSVGHHHRCYREKATSRYVMMGKRGIELIDLKGDTSSRNNWIRGTCQYGILPANGLTYAPPNSCGCYMESLLHGFYALATQRPVVTDSQRRISDGKRLEKGPAYGKTATSANGAESWPQYRANVLRSGIAKTKVPVQMKQGWKAQIGGRLTQPTVAGGKVMLAAIDENTVYALSEKDGKVAWKYTCGGRVDSPPAIHNGQVLFGSADGYVQCLNLEDGTLAWRFLASPADLRTVAFDQVESLWPVHGSVLVFKDVAYFSAGRSTWIDDGITLYGLDPATGKILHQAHYVSRHPKLKEGKDRKEAKHVVKRSQNLTDYKTHLQPDLSDSFSMAGGAVSDVLVSDGINVFLHQSKFTPDLKAQKEMTRHLFSTSSLLDGAENHRSHWVLGTGDFSLVPVAYSWVANRPGRWNPGMAVPRGVMLTFDESAVYLVRRGGDANGKYQLLKVANKPFAKDEKPLPDFRQVPKEERNKSVWSAALPVRPRAILKSGEHLFIAAMPIAGDAGDAHAGYEGRKGGMIFVASAKDGSRTAELKLDSAVVWDGMAAANGKLFVSHEDGSIRCFGAP